MEDVGRAVDLGALRRQSAADDVVVRDQEPDDFIGGAALDEPGVSHHVDEDVRAHGRWHASDSALQQRAYSSVVTPAEADSTGSPASRCGRDGARQFTSAGTRSAAYTPAATAIAPPTNRDVWI